MRGFRRFQDPHPQYHAAALPVAYDTAGEYLYFRSLRRPRQPPHLDPEGIGLFMHGERWVHNPATTAAQGLWEFSLWSANKTEENLTAAAHIGRWLCRTQDSDSGKWIYEFDYRPAGFKRGLLAPWSSAMAQGQAISLLTRLHRVTGEHGYLAAARSACAPLEQDVHEGGLRADLFGHPFYEEYPTDPPSFVLNGFIHALLGLYDLKELGDDRATKLFDGGMHTLIWSLPFYDARGVSTYDLGHITSPPRKVNAYLGYHRKHGSLLRALYSVWPDETIAFYASLWAGLWPEPIHRRLLRALVLRRSAREIRNRLRA